MVPVLAVGFNGLKTRINMQEAEQKNLTERLDVSEPYIGIP
jgi:hypothetical protein